MKSIILVVVVLFAFSVESASHKKLKTAMKASDASEGIAWPQPEVIRAFEVPPEFTENQSTPTIEADEPSTASSGKHHGKSNHKSHSH